MIHISTKLVLEAEKLFSEPQISVLPNDKDESILIYKYTMFQQIQAYMVLAIKSSDSNVSNWLSEVFSHNKHLKRQMSQSKI